METCTMEAKTTLEHVLTDTSDGVFMLDGDCRCVLFSRACERLTGYTAEEMLAAESGRNISMGDPARSPLGVLGPGLNDLRTGTVDTLRQHVRLFRKDGSLVRVQADSTALRDEHNRLVGVLGVLRPQPASGGAGAAEETIPEDLAGELERRRIAAREKYGFANLIGNGTRMCEVLDRIRAACEQPCPVLLVGELGTGKEAAARTIHDHSSRRDGRFVSVHCGAQQDRLDQVLFGDSEFAGVIRAAEGGTLYLEEVGALPPDIQKDILQVIEHRRARTPGAIHERAVDVRIIASNRRPLIELVAEQTFREDLFAQLGIVTIQLPPLRERLDDIPFLVQQHLMELNKRSTHRQVERIDSEVWGWLFRYRWPGNVRELNSAVESAFAIGRGAELVPDHLPDLIRGELVALDDAAGRLDQPLDDVLASVERSAILTALRRTEGQRSQAAREMGISRSRLYRRMEALGIHPREDL